MPVQRYQQRLILGARRAHRAHGRHRRVGRCRRRRPAAPDAGRWAAVSRAEKLIGVAWAGSMLAATCARLSLPDGPRSTASRCASASRRSVWSSRSSRSLIPSSLCRRWPPRCRCTSLLDDILIQYRSKGHKEGLRRTTLVRRKERLPRHDSETAARHGPGCSGPYSSSKRTDRVTCSGTSGRRVCSQQDAFLRDLWTPASASAANPG